MKNKKTEPETKSTTKVASATSNSGPVPANPGAAKDNTGRGQTMFEISQEEQGKFEGGAKIKVVGVGGGGCNAVNTMIRAGLTGVEYIVANTDIQAIRASLASTKVQLGMQITKGLGAGANPEVGRKAALDEYESLSEVLQGADMVFVTAGMGGGTGTGAAPVIAKLAKELGALTVGVVTRPFLFEGKKRYRVAEEGICALEENVDSLITIPNQRLLHIAGEDLSLVDTFKRCDEILLNAVRGISDLINSTGHINADFADVSTVMTNKGLALMGTGIASGQDRAIKAATDAISSPLLEDISIDGATGIIINISGPQSMTMHEVNEAVTLIMEAADDNAEIIFGTVIDDTLEDQVKVTVIATGLGGQVRVKASRPKGEGEKIAAPTTPAAPAPPAPSASLAGRGENSNAEFILRERLAPENLASNNPTPPPAAEEPTFTATSSFSSASPSASSETITRHAEPESDLVKSIRQAATHYGPAENTTANPAATSPSPLANSASVNSERQNKANGRARSIAEKLGFINFDEEQLDTPSFLRKENTSSRRADNLL
ncbi:MAG: cell division protein FtsZ [Bacteriovoracaceae bacterium]|nr:cell division protein FtsZ [Bacteriovoracaceae bacterium]